MTEPRIEQKPGTRTISATAPGVITTLGKQPDPRAVKAFHAMIRKSLRDHRKQG